MRRWLIWIAGGLTSADARATAIASEYKKIRCLALFGFACRLFEGPSMPAPLYTSHPLRLASCTRRVAICFMLG